MGCCQARGEGEEEVVGIELREKQRKPRKSLADVFQDGPLADGKLDRADLEKMKADSDAALAEAAANAKQGAKNFLKFGSNFADKADILGLAAKAKQVASDLGIEEIKLDGLFDDDDGDDAASDGGWDEVTDEDVFEEEVLSRGNLMMLRKVEVEKVKQAAIVERMVEKLAQVAEEAEVIATKLNTQAEDLKEIEEWNEENTSELVVAENCVRHSVSNTGGQVAGESGDEGDGAEGGGDGEDGDGKKKKKKKDGELNVPNISTAQKLKLAMAGAKVLSTVSGIVS